METKAPNLEVIASATLEPHDNLLTVNIEPLPATEFSHEMLAAILDPVNPPEVQFINKTVGDRIQLEVKFQHVEVIARAKNMLDLKKEAKNRNMLLADLVAEKDREAKAAAEMQAQENEDLDELEPDGQKKKKGKKAQG